MFRPRPLSNSPLEVLCSRIAIQILGLPLSPQLMTLDNVIDEGEIDIMTLNEIVSYLEIDTGGGVVIRSKPLQAVTRGNIQRNCCALKSVCCT